MGHNVMTFDFNLRLVLIETRVILINWNFTPTRPRTEPRGEKNMKTGAKSGNVGD